MRLPPVLFLAAAGLGFACSSGDSETRAALEAPEGAAIANLRLGRVP